MRLRIQSVLALAGMAGALQVPAATTTSSEVIPTASGQFVLLPTLPDSPYTVPEGINGRGEVVGLSNDPVTGQHHAILWTSSGRLRDLASNAEAYAINDDGRVVGDMGMTPGYWVQGVFHRVADVGTNAAVNAKGIMAGEDDTNLALFSKNGERRLGGLQGAYRDSAQGLNIALDEVGTSVVITSAGPVLLVPHIHREGQATLALSMPGNNGAATAINDAGLIAGASWQTDGRGNTLWSCAIRWDRLQPACLPWSTSFAGARAVDSTGDIVGWGQAADGRSHAVLWLPSGAVDLNDGMPAAWRDAGWVLTSANAINDAGTIAGEMVGPDGRTRTWLLRLDRAATR